MVSIVVSGSLSVWNHHNLVKNRHDSSKVHQRHHLDHIHVLNISVTDGLYMAYSRLTVTITPVNNFAPLFTHDQYRVHVTENLPSETAVTVLIASDQDWGEFGEFTYHFVGEEATKNFRISETTGK